MPYGYGYGVERTSFIAATKVDLGSNSASAPILQNVDGTISVVTAGYPAPPILTNTNGTITAEAA